MNSIKTISLLFGILLITVLIMGCNGKMTCINISGMPVTPETNEIVIDNVVFKSAILPDTTPSGVEVNDYCPPGGGGGNELVIGWSQYDTGPAEYARIVFPAGDFPSGVSKVEVTCMHYNACRMEAYNSGMTLLDSDNHTAGERVFQTLTLEGEGIFTIKVIGAEIGISKLCYEK